VSGREPAIRIGCSGWNYASWREPVYGGAPQRRWLSLYAERFDTVEVNSTFYRLPTTKAVQGWADATPAGFTFAVKASRYLTHVRRLRGVEEGASRFLARLEPLVRARKLGPILWQLPATFHRNDDRLAGALAELPAGRHALEFRHETWFVPEVYELLERHGVALVVGDHPERPFQPFRLTADWTFLRFHYGRRGRDGNYAPSEIRSWGERIRAAGVETWAYFNNDWQAFAVANAEALEREVARERKRDGEGEGEARLAPTGGGARGSPARRAGRQRRS